MTGAPPVLDRPALRAALRDMRIDPPDPGARFESALATLHGWESDFAERVADEYRRFLYVAATAGFEVTPSRYVDEAWHLHLSLPHYREILCDRILGRPLEHRPGTGTPEDQARCERQYEQTLALYERIFEEPAPGDIWPRPDAVEEEAEDEGSLGRGAGGRAIGIGAAALSFLAALWACLSGADALGSALVVAAVLIVFVSFRDLKGRRRRGGGRGDCGGGDSGGDSGGDCGSSCGGGCGGD